ncbi:MAG TPA: hypothetical protein VFS34_04700 [Thermoanaerobaculia bacterium]|nr:hypothetical protein [Thermoanaerobaculia bacterium]
MHGSFGDHEAIPGKIVLNDATPPWVRSSRSGYSAVGSGEEDGIGR